MKKKLIKKDVENAADAQWNIAIFMAISFAALLTLGIVLYLKFSPSVRDNKTVVSVESKVVDYQKQVQDKIQEKLPVPKEAMAFPSADVLKGTWVTKFSASGMATITMAGGLYEVVLAQNAKEALRQYSRGTYKYNAKDGKLELFPSQEYGEPKPVRGVYYKILTMRKFDVYVRQKQGDASLYFMAPENDVITKAVHPMFLYSDYVGAPVLRFDAMSSQSK